MVIRRSVAVEALEEYDRHWRSLRDAVVTSAGHAWRFTAPGAPAESAEYLEFIEFREGADPRARPDAEQALAALERLAAASSREEWIDANLE